MVIITGPTGVGKTELSIALAQYFNADILSADSRQIYQGLKIGTAAPSTEDLQKVKHYFIATQNINNYYSVSQYEIEAIAILDKIYQNKNIAFLVGGTGLYIDAVEKGIDFMPDPDMKIRAKLNDTLKNEGLEKLQNQLKELDPQYYQKVDLKNAVRIIRALEVCLQTGKTYSSFRKATAKHRNFKTIKIALNINREELYQRINKRVDNMIAQGLTEEAKLFYPYKGITALKTVGYQELFSAFDGEITLEEAIQKIKNNSRKYARRQITWFRRDKNYHYFEPQQKTKIQEFIQSFLSEKEST